MKRAKESVKTNSQATKTKQQIITPKRTYNPEYDYVDVPQRTIQESGYQKVKK